MNVVTINFYQQLDLQDKIKGLQIKNKEETLQYLNSVLKGKENGYYK